MQGSCQGLPAPLCPVDSSLIAHTCGFKKLLLAWSAMLFLFGFHCGVSFISISALADFFMTAVRSFRGLGCPQQAFCIFVRVRRKIQCLLFLLRYGAYFFRLSLSLCSGFRCSVSEFVERMRHLSPPLRSAVSRSRSSVMPSIIIGVNILNWYGAGIAQSGRQFDESGGCFFGAAVV